MFTYCSIFEHRSKTKEVSDKGNRKHMYPGVRTGMNIVSGHYMVMRGWVVMYPMNITPQHHMTRSSTWSSHDQGETTGLPNNHLEHVTASQ